MRNSYVIRGAKTIAQYKILKWVNMHFEEDSVSIKFIDNCTAQIEDDNQDTMVVSYSNGQVLVKE